MLAKPAEQTPLIAAEAVRLLSRPACPALRVQLLPGQGETVGARLIGDQRVMGVMFTGSTEVARIIATQRGRAPGRPAGQPIPLIAETGGQNAMIVDSSALAEQVVGDVLSSAFDSAGQRCSALRVLCVQDEVADRVVEHAARRHGRTAAWATPTELSADVGPVIDAEAQTGIVQHIEKFRSGAEGHPRVPAPQPPSRPSAPRHLCAAHTDRAEPHRRAAARSLRPRAAPGALRPPDLDQLLDQINATGYGLTLGVHTRIDETIARR